MRTIRRLSLAALLAASAYACGSGGSDSSQTDTGADVEDAESDATDASTEDTDADDDIGADVTLPPPSIDDAGCDDTRRPVIMAHGFLASGDTYANTARRLASNGWCLSRIFAFDWNTLERGGEVTLLDETIDAILVETGAEQVDLMGHSAGGGLGYDYLSDPDRAAKVAHYVHLASFPSENPAGPDGDVPTMNIWSAGDTTVEGADIPGATNVNLTTEDHYQVATSVEAFEAIYEFITDGEMPTTTDIVPTDEVAISGMALQLGTNVPTVGAIEIYAVDPMTGFRDGEPVHSIRSAEDGSWGPVRVDASALYEFYVLPDGEDETPVHYYFESFERTNHLVYLRTLPEPTGLAGILLSVVRFDDAHTVLVTFTANRASVVGRDTLTVDGIDLATDELAAAEDTTIAYFLYDDNGNGMSDEVANGVFGSQPFLQGYDLFFDASELSTITLESNGSVLRVPTWRSQSDGATIAVFQ